MDFIEYVNKKMPGLFLLQVATDSIVPGTILKMPKRNLKPIGTAWEALGEDGSLYPLRKSDANMLEGTLRGSLAVKGNASLFGIISLSGDKSETYEVDYALTGMSAREFKGIGEITLKKKLRKLKSTDKETWSIIDENLVVLICYYVSDFTATFKMGGTTMSKGALEKIVEGGISGTRSTEYTSAGTITVTKNSKVPFGVKGFIL